VKSQERSEEVDHTTLGIVVIGALAFAFTCIGFCLGVGFMILKSM